MNYIKEKIKENRLILALYEIIFGKLHKMLFDISKEFKRIRTRITTKTHFCYGDKNKDKTFFVISAHTKEMGIYSTIFYILPFIDYAVKHNYIPAIDLQKTFMPVLQDEDRKGKENPWEYYYEQPLKQYDLKEIYQSRHVIVMADYVFKVKMPNWNDMFPADEKELKYWNQIIRSYIRLNHDLESRVEVERKRIFKENCKVLGVGIRAGLRAGAMRGGEVYNNHPKQPTCEELMNIVEKKMLDWNCDALFISSDDREYSNKFISRFGNKCFYINRKLIHFFKDDVPIVNMPETRVEYVGSTVKERTKEYIVEIYLLAQCDCLYSCVGGGAEFAYFLNGGKYEHCEVYNQGFYSISPNSDKEKNSISGYKFDTETKS